jgi:hypothetical protein
MTNSVVVSNFKQMGVIGRVGSGAVNLVDCYLIGTSVFSTSLNNNITPEEQEALHNPETNSYVSYNNDIEAYKAYLKDGFKTTEFVGKMVDEMMSDVAKQVLLLSSDNVSELLTFEGNTIILTEDIDMATAYTDNGGLWSSTASFAGTFDGQGYEINNLYSDTGLFLNFNGTIKNVAITNVKLTANAGAISKGYVRTGAGDVHVNDVFVSITETSSWYAGILVQ